MNWVKLYNKDYNSRMYEFNFPEGLQFMLTNIFNASILKILATHDFTNCTEIYGQMCKFIYRKCNFNSEDIFWGNIRPLSIDLNKAKPYSCNECIIKNIIE